MISYQTDGIEMPAIKKRETTEWIKAVAATYNKRIGEIAYIFCSDEKILEVNRQYLQHDYYTDIITFDYCEGNRLSGDLFISLDTNCLPAMTTNGSCTASSSTASCTFAALTTKDRENGKSWKPPKTRHSPCDKIDLSEITDNQIYNSFSSVISEVYMLYLHFFTEKR